MANTAASTDEIDFDFSQLDETLINDQQKQHLIEYINQIKTQKRTIHEEFNTFKLSTGKMNVFNPDSCLNDPLYFAQLFFHFFSYIRLFSSDEKNERTNERHIRLSHLLFSIFCSLYIYVFVDHVFCFPLSHRMERTVPPMQDE
jgi:hypothetical protein